MNSLYKYPEFVFQRIWMDETDGLFAVARNFMETDIGQYPVGSKERWTAVESYKEFLNSTLKQKIVIQFILENGMYPFLQEAYIETMKKAQEIAQDKSKMKALVQQTSFCSNWNHQDGAYNPKYGPCNFAHTMEEYKPPHCIYERFCEKDACNKNHGILTTDEWIYVKDITVPVFKQQVQLEFCRSVWKNSREQPRAEVFCRVPNCPYMHSIWELLEKFPNYKQKTGIELMESITIPCAAFRATDQNKKEKHILTAADVESEYVPKDAEDDVEDDEDDEEVEEVDSDDDDGPSIFIDQQAIQSHNDDIEAHIVFQEMQKDDIDVQLAFQEMQEEEEESIVAKSDDYVMTMANLLDMPLIQIQDMVDMGKKHIVDMWLEKKMMVFV